MTTLLAAVFLLQIQVRDEPKDWKLLETANFDVHYPGDELLTRAKEFGGWFEQARKELVATMGVEPKRVHVFMYRSFHDLLQASFFGSPRAQPLSQKVREPALRNPPRTLEGLMASLGREDGRACRINPHARALAIAEPLRDRIFIHCQASDRWNYWFIKHELAHHVQFEHLYSFRMPSWMIALKDPVIPSWWWEGGADYWAAIFDSRKDQYVRDLADERLYDLKELYFPDVINFHDLRSIYYQGSYFWRFLDQEYGPGMGRKLFDRTDQGLPLASQKPVQHVTGRSRAQIEREFGENLKRTWAPMMEGRTVPADRLTDTRAYYRRRTWGGRYSPDGKHLAWVGDGNVYPELYIDGEGQFGLWRGITTGFMVSPPSWSPDSRRIAVIEWTTNRDQLVLLDVGGGSESIKLREFDELYDPAWSPDGTKIAFSALKDGTSDLYLLHLADRRVERVTDDPHADGAPAWSPDGRLAYVKDVEGRTVLHVGKEAVTKSWALLENPQWSPDGKSIVVAADVGGVYDAFEVDPATGRAKRLTKLRGGVSHPAYHPTDGTIVITYAQGRGSDLYRVKPEPQDEPGFDEEARKPWYEQFRKPVPQGEPAEKSRVWGVNWLMFPVSSLSLLAPGLEFSFGDRDGENTLTLGGYGVGSRAFTASATVANTRYRPTIGVNAAASRFGDLLEARGEPFVELPLWPTIATGGGWVARFRDQQEDDFPDPHVFDSGPTAALRFSDQIPLHLHDWEWGFAFGGSASFFSEKYGGDRELNEYFAFVEASLNFLGEDWLLWTRSIFEKKAGRRFLEDEFLRVAAAVRGTETLEGIELFGATLELRFPLWRDLMWKPFEAFGLGEWLILKDLRGFVFGDLGRIATEVGGLVDQSWWAWSTGAGLRLDFSFMLWPLVNQRVPMRIEFWGAWVGQPFEDNKGAVGFAYTIGF
ncbi:MAG TPA: hypothetical protein VJB14_04075 [Planctomycetota bacterium]|nr:hypothetical protein [Planctomycetota bacterium]